MTGSDRLFDRYVIVDWSSNAKPKRGKDSIWIGSLGAGDERPDPVVNPATRTEARERVRTLLRAAVDGNERVLVGFDFAYGYSRGFAAALSLDGVAWRAVWDYLAAEIVDGPKNANNRFAVAAEMNRRLGTHVFWACPPSAAGEHLSSKKDRTRYFLAEGDTALPEWRATERAITTKASHPQPVWKLFTAGAVGGQALVGIPVVAALRDDPVLAPCSVVWPFETIASENALPVLPAGRAAIVHAEIWPAIVDDAVTRAMQLPEHAGKVKDRVQVEQLARHLRTLDHDGRLAALFAAAPPIAAEEGWILGAPAPR